jgi:Lar family restriction alleviation protein
VSEIKLLPCPFCGGKADLFSWSQIPLNYQYGIECRECHTLFQINQYDTTMQDTIKQWNARKPMERILTRLEECEKDCRQYKYMTDFQAQAKAYLKAQEIIKEEGGIE